LHAAQYSLKHITSEQPIDAPRTDLDTHIRRRKAISAN